MSKVSIHGSEYSIGKVFGGDFVFSIPLYQRPYSWTTEHASELLGDLTDFIKNEGNIDVHDMNPYFLGSIVLIKADDPDSQIVDGQQRLITLTILLAALRVKMKERDARDLTKFIYDEGNKMMGTPDHYRLTLRDKDVQFFRDHIQADDGFLKLKEMDNGGLSDTRQNIMENALCILELLDDFSESEIINISKFIITRCFLVVVTTPDFDSAYRIFSILNDRGLDLSYVFSWSVLRLAFGDYSILSVPMLPVSS